MSDELARLYRSALDPDCLGHLNEITDTILVFYDRCETVSLLIDLIGQAADAAVQWAAVIGLKQCLLRKWNIGFAKSASGLCVRKAILDLARELPLELARVLIDFARPVFVSEGENWPELVALLYHLREAHENVLLASHLLGAMVEAIGPEFAERHLELMVDFGNAAISFGDDEGFASAYYLFSLFSLLPPHVIDAHPEVFSTPMDVFATAVSRTYSNTAFAIARRFADCFSGEGLPNAPCELLAYLLRLLNEPPPEARIGPDWILCVFIPIHTLLKCAGSALCGQTTELLEVILRCTEALLMQGSYYDNDNASFIASTVDIIISAVNDPSFFRLLKCLKDLAETDQLLIAYSYMLFNSIDCASEAILEIVPFILSLARECLTSTSCEMREIALLIVREVSADLGEGHTEDATELVATLVSFFNEPYTHPLIPPALSALTAVLAHSAIAPAIIPNVCEHLLLIRQSQALEVQALAVEAIGSLVLATNNDPRPCVLSLFETTLAAARIPQDEDPILVERAILALRHFVRYASSSSDMAMEVVNVIFSLDKSEDIDIRNAVIESVTDLIHQEIPILLGYGPRICRLVRDACSTALFLGDFSMQGDEGSTLPKGWEQCAPSSQGFAALVNMMKLITAMFQSYPVLLPENPAMFVNFAFLFMQLPFPELSIPAISAALYASLHGACADLSDFYEQLSATFHNSNNYWIQCACFKTFAILIRRDAVLPVIVLTWMIEFAAQALGDEESNRRHREFSRETSRSFYAFIDALGRRAVDFPLSQLIDHVATLAERTDQPFELARSVEILRSYYQHANVDDRARVMIITGIKQAFLHYMQSFEEDETKRFFFEPTPIDALTAVVQRDPLETDDIMEPALDLMSHILTGLNSGQCFFWVTQTSAAAFVCALLRQASSAGDIRAHFVPLVLSSLPIRAGWQHADELYGSLFRILEQHGTFQMDAQMQYVIVTTMGLNDRQFDRLRLTQPTYAALLRIGQSLIN
jgi:hypothetical protein